MNQSMTPRRSRRELALNVGAVAGTVCILATLASVFFGITPLVLRSGSMAPQISTGALALARTVPAADLRFGDIVSVDTRRAPASRTAWWDCRTSAVRWPSP